MRNPICIEFPDLNSPWAFIAMAPVQQRHFIRTHVTCSAALLSDTKEDDWVLAALTPREVDLMPVLFFLCVLAAALH